MINSKLTFDLIRAFSFYHDWEYYEDYDGGYTGSTVYAISNNKKVSFKFKNVLADFNSIDNISEILKLEQYLCDRYCIVSRADLLYFRAHITEALTNIFKAVLNRVYIEYNALEHYTQEEREYIKLNKAQEYCQRLIDKKTKMAVFGMSWRRLNYV